MQEANNYGEKMLSEVERPGIGWLVRKYTLGVVDRYAYEKYVPDTRRMSVFRIHIQIRSRRLSP